MSGAARPGRAPGGYRAPADGNARVRSRTAEEVERTRAARETRRDSLDDQPAPQLLADQRGAAGARSGRSSPRGQSFRRARAEGDELLRVAVRIRPPPALCVDGRAPDGFSALRHDGQAHPLGGSPLRPRPEDTRSSAWGGSDMGELAARWQWSDRSVVKATGDNTGQQFRYAHVFAPHSQTHEVYETVCRSTVLHALNGHNASIFAYGQTNSGKTYSIVGLPEVPGVIPLACVDAFNHIRGVADGVRMLLRVSYLEIYNEELKDLLGEPESTLKLCEDDAAREVVVTGLTERIVSCLDDVLGIIADGNRRRAVGSNTAHEHASRSHAVFQLVIESRDFRARQVRVSRLNIVDLAGSETHYVSVDPSPAAAAAETVSRLRERDTIAARLAAQAPAAVAARQQERVKEKEGSNIRRSLNALVRVVQVLAAGSNTHIPYRDSKLTRLLRDAIGGNSHTCCLCTVNPEEDKETMATLRFAAAAQRIHNQPRVVAVATDKAMIGRLESNLRELQEELFIQGQAGTEEVEKLRKHADEERMHLRQTIGDKDEQVGALERRLSGLEKFLLTAERARDKSTSLAGRYAVPEGHGGGMTAEQLRRQVEEEEAARQLAKTRRRRRLSVPCILLRDKKSQSLFPEEKDRGYQPEEHTAAGLLRLASGRAAREFHSGAAGEAIASLRSQLAEQRRRCARLQADLAAADAARRDIEESSAALRAQLVAKDAALHAAEEREREEARLRLAAERRAEEAAARAAQAAAPYGGDEVDELRRRAERAEEEARARGVDAAGARKARDAETAAREAVERELADLKRRAEGAPKKRAGGGCCG